jgi:hypothetical protein
LHRSRTQTDAHSALLGCARSPISQLAPAISHLVAAKLNIGLTDVVPQLDLFDRNWPIWTYTEITPPSKFVHDEEGRRGEAISSLVSGGCIISGARLRTDAGIERVRERKVDPQITAEIHHGLRSHIISMSISKNHRNPFDVSRPHASGRGENHPGARRDRRRQDSGEFVEFGPPFGDSARPSLEIVAIEKKIMMGRVGRSACWLDRDPTRMVEAGYGPTTK